MRSTTRRAALAIAGTLATMGGLRAQTITTTPFRAPVTAAPLPYWAPAPYWTTPYWSTPYWASPNNAAQTPGTATTLPGFTSAQPQPVNPPADSTPADGSTCIAPGYTCPFRDPSSSGQPCTCPAIDSGTVNGVVR